MNTYTEYEQKTSLSIRSLKIVDKILRENPTIKRIFNSAKTANDAIEELKSWLYKLVEEHLEIPMEE